MDRFESNYSNSTNGAGSYNSSSNRRRGSYSPFSAFEGRSTDDGALAGGGNRDSESIQAPDSAVLYMSHTHTQNQHQPQLPRIQHAPSPQRPVITRKGDSNSERMREAEQREREQVQEEQEHEHEHEQEEHEQEQTDSSTSDLEPPQPAYHNSSYNDYNQASSLTSSSASSASSLAYRRRSGSGSNFGFGGVASTAATAVAGNGNGNGNGRPIRPARPDSGTMSVTGSVISSYTQLNGGGSAAGPGLPPGAAAPGYQHQQQQQQQVRTRAGTLPGTGTVSPNNNNNINNAAAGGGGNNNNNIGNSSGNGSYNRHSRRLSSTGSVSGVGVGIAVSDDGSGGSGSGAAAVGSWAGSTRTASPGPMLSPSATAGNGSGVGNGVGVGPRAVRQPPPSAFRASGGRNSFSGLYSAPTSTENGNGNGNGNNNGVVNLNGQDATDAHPLSSPGASVYSTLSNGTPGSGMGANNDAQFGGADGGNNSSIGHGSYVSAQSHPQGGYMNLNNVGNGNGHNGGNSNNNNAGQYPYNGFNGYQYPPSSSSPPPPGSTNPMNMNMNINSPNSMSPTSPMSPMSSNGYGHGHGYSSSSFSGFVAPVPRNTSYIANSAVMASSRNGSAVDLVPYAARINGLSHNNVGPGSVRASMDDYVFVPPQAPFAQGQGHAYPPSLPGTPGTATPELRHAGSASRLREPFLSPASRRSSTVWTPPASALYSPGPNSAGVGGAGTGGVYGPVTFGGGGSSTNLALAIHGQKEPLPSSALSRKLSISQKPWLKRKQKGERLSWWLTFCTLWVGAIIGAVVIYFGYSNVDVLDDSQLCSVLDEDFSSGSLNTDVWTRNVSLGGFGNGEFEMMTSSDDNLYIKNSELYFMPTLTSDEIGTDSIFDGYTYNLTDCTETWNATDCSVTSKNSTGTVINPVKSARISTRNSTSGGSIAYGKVEISAKMPKGDWLWPAIWMLPKDEKYGTWPLSGEIDLVEARGNDANYGSQGRNYVRSSLIWGPLNNVFSTYYGWQEQKRTSYADGFHTYTLEWTDTFMRISVDKRTTAMLTLTDIDKKSFWTRGDFPDTATSTANGTAGATVAVTNPWEGQSNSAPFDQEFYLVIDLAVGGTSGWFPDGVGGKMWLDGSVTAMTDFAKKQDEWYATWPDSDDDRALRIKSVKMWSLCS